VNARVAAAASLSVVSVSLTTAAPLFLEIATPSDDAGDILLCRPEGEDELRLPATSLATGPQNPVSGSWR